ncbi:MAG TPA: acyltransferase family protein [Anaerolineales bacterium]|nr:acyltransferase family protein [Anaerolineales bacterium]
MTSTSERRYDLDWLRVLGVLLLVPFHVALIFVFDPFTIMYIRDTVNSRVLAEVTGFIHMWHMPMLFMISGAATWFALGHRSAGEYISERSMRLFLPLVFGILTYGPFTIYLQHSNALSLQEGYAGFFQIDLNQLDGMNGTFTPAHLWFILFLFVFSLVGLPIFQWLRTERGRSIIERLGRAIQTPLSLTVLGIPLTLAAATGILGDMNPLYYFLIFFFGFVFASDMRFQKSIDKLTWIALAYGVAETAINIIFPIRNFTQWTPQWMVLGFTYQLGRWMLTLATLGLGHRFLNFTNGALQYASAAAMPFYLLHMTFSVVTGYFVIQLDAPVAVKYPLIVLVATGLTLLAYELMRRWGVTRLLFGMKKRGYIDNAILDTQLHQ